MNVVYLFPKNYIKCPFKTTIYMYLVVLKGHYILKGTFGKMYACPHVIVRKRRKYYLAVLSC